MMTLDVLTYTYNGNRQTRVDDSATGVTNVDYQQFYDGASETTEYLYDQNGNMTVDKNIGITRVSYDANNQPDSVTFSTGESIRYYNEYPIFPKFKIA